MKPNLKLGFALTVAIFAVALLFLSAKRNRLRKVSRKEAKISGEPINTEVSNTDYIFFESLSKYLFISVK